MEIKGQRYNPMNAIPGLSDQFRPYVLGAIRLGVKARTEGGKIYPKETDYFVVPPEVEVIYGPRPRQLDIMFQQNDQTLIFPQAYKRWGQSKGLVCIGNGIIGQEKLEIGGYKKVKCPCDYHKNKKCSIQATLYFYLSLVDTRGVYRLTTTSINSIIDINSAIISAKQLLVKGAGTDDITFKPFILKRVPTETHHNQQKQTHYTLKLERNWSDHDVERLRLMVKKQASESLPAPGQDIRPTSITSGGQKDKKPPGSERQFIDTTPEDLGLDLVDEFIDEVSGKDDAVPETTDEKSDENSPQAPPREADEEETEKSIDHTIESEKDAIEAKKEEFNEKSRIYNALIKECDKVARHYQKSREYTQAMIKIGKLGMYDFDKKIQILERFLVEAREGDHDTTQENNG